VSPLRYKLGFCIQEDGILHSHRHENLISYVAITDWSLEGRRVMSPMRYELGLYIPEEGILHSHRCENLKSYIDVFKTTHYLEGKAVFGLSTEINPQDLCQKEARLTRLFAVCIPSSLLCGKTYRDSKAQILVAVFSCYVSRKFAVESSQLGSQPTSQKSSQRYIAVPCCTRQICRSVSHSPSETISIGVYPSSCSYYKESVYIHGFLCCRKM
jgi:hypothetical protein